MVSVAMADDNRAQSVLLSSLQNLRDSVLESLCSGSPLLINLGMLSPDFDKVYTHPEFFPSEAILNYDSLQTSRLFKSLLRSGNTNPTFSYQN